MPADVTVPDPNRIKSKQKLGAETYVKRYIETQIAVTPPESNELATQLGHLLRRVVAVLMSLHERPAPAGRSVLSIGSEAPKTWSRKSRSRERWVK